MQRNNNIARIIAIRDNLMPDKAQKSRDKSRKGGWGQSAEKKEVLTIFFNL